MQTKDYGAVIVIGVVVFALMVGFALWDMIAPTWSDHKTWAVLLGCIGVPALFGLGLGGYALHNLQENLADSRDEKRLARERREAERKRMEAQRESVDYMTMQQILRILTSVGKAQVSEEYNDFRRSKMVTPPEEVYGLINGTEYEENEQIVDGKFHV